MEKIFDTDKKIRLGIWGLGRGGNFIEAAKSMNYEIVAGCDCNADLRDSFRKECPSAMVTADDKEFLAFKNMDAVLIATFFNSHAEHTIRALNAGFHVLCEVTSFFTPAEGVRVVEAVEKSGRIYNLLENYPFTKENFALSDLWQKGFFGDFMYGEFNYLHECRSLCYGYNQPDTPPIEPGNMAHSWRSWLDFHYYNTHSLGPVMKITGLRPERITAFPDKVSLPGYLPGSRMGTVCPSLIQMSNGGIVRNLTGATTSDQHMGKKIWGTRASAESLGDGFRINVGACGNSLKLNVNPQWPCFGDAVDASGHSGGDFWELYYFARQIFTGKPSPWDIYSSCDVTLAGIMAVRSCDAGGEPMEIPDFRKKEVREKYRFDESSQKHFDPKKIFPEDSDFGLTGNFNRVILSLEKDVVLLRKAVDGAALQTLLKDDHDRMSVLKLLHKAIASLPDLEIHYNEAKELAAAYPDSPAADALNGMMSLAQPEFCGDLSALRDRLEKLKAEMLS